ncbi:rhomboid domain-containing protein 2 [Hoplias malabaricus]|uniref:rhomboid domain-containing protein 2 n=1 Tax=Hoplias malabaricus TaxID=27720 RepID=UPI0034622E0B
MRSVLSKGLGGCSRMVGEFGVSSGVMFTVAVSTILCVVSGYLHISEQILSLESSSILNGQVHRLLIYSFYHKDVGHLFLSVVVLVIFCSGLEKGVGTVRFLHQLFLLSTFVGLLHVFLELMLFSPPNRSLVSGLIPVSLAILGTVTIRSPMRKALLLGVNVPTASLPWLLLLLFTFFIPNTVFLCNAVAVIIGEIYGMGWVSVLEMSESRACVLEKKIPFRLLKKMAGVQFVPASAEERKKTLHAICNPPPGSYPVQAYAPVPNLTLQATESLHNHLDGWPYAVYMQQHGFGASHGHSHWHGYGYSHGQDCGHAHGHSHQHLESSVWTPNTPHAHSQFNHFVNITGPTFNNQTQATHPAMAQAPLPESLTTATVLPS